MPAGQGMWYNHRLNPARPTPRDREQPIGSQHDHGILFCLMTQPLLRHGTQCRPDPLRSTLQLLPRPGKS